MSKRSRCGAVRFFCFLWLRIGVWTRGPAAISQLLSAKVVRAMRFAAPARNSQVAKDA